MQKNLQAVKKQVASLYNRADSRLPHACVRGNDRLHGNDALKMPGKPTRLVLVAKHVKDKIQNYSSMGRGQ